MKGRKLCLICHNRVPRHSRWSPSVETLEDIFTTFCKYIAVKRQDVSLDLTVDTFPFCRSCRQMLLQIQEDHNVMIRRVLKRMEKVQGKVAAKMISSESEIACSNAKDKSYNIGLLKSESRSREENPTTFRDSRAAKFRKSFLSRFTPTVSISYKEQILCKRKMADMARLSKIRETHKKQFSDTSSSSSSTDFPGDNDSSTDTSSEADSSSEESANGAASVQPCPNTETVHQFGPSRTGSCLIDHPPSLPNTEQKPSLVPSNAFLSVKNPVNLLPQHLKSIQEWRCQMCDSEFATPEDLCHHLNLIHVKSTSKMVEHKVHSRIEEYHHFSVIKPNETFSVVEHHSVNSLLEDSMDFETIDTHELELLRGMGNDNNAPIVSTEPKRTSKFLYHGNNGVYPFERIGNSTYKCGSCEYCSKKRCFVMEHIRKKHDCKAFVLHKVKM